MVGLAVPFLLAAISAECALFARYSGRGATLLCNHAPSSPKRHRLLCRAHVAVQMEEVVRVVLALERGQSLIALAVRRPHRRIAVSA